MRLIASSWNYDGEDWAALLRGVDVLAFWDMGGGDGEFSGEAYQTP